MRETIFITEGYLTARVGSSIRHIGGSVMIWSSSADGLITYASPEWATFTGQPLSEALGNGWLRYLHPDDVERTEEDFAKALSMSAPFTFRYRLKHHTLGFVEIITSATPSFSPIDGCFIGYIGALTDVDHKHLDIPDKNLIGCAATFQPTSLAAPTTAIDMIADHLLIARTLALKVNNTRMLPSLDFAISEVMRELNRGVLHATVQ